MNNSENIDRAEDYIRAFINKGGIWAIEHAENDVYMIGSSFESLIEDFQWQYCKGFNVQDVTKEEAKHILNTLDNHCLDENETDFYENVEQAINEVIEAL